MSMEPGGGTLPHVCHGPQTVSMEPGGDLASCVSQTPDCEYGAWGDLASMGVTDPRL